MLRKRDMKSVSEAPLKEAAALQERETSPSLNRFFPYIGEALNLNYLII